MVAEIVGLSISSVGWREVVRHVEACRPEEACGFLTGRDGRVDVVLPVENAEHSRVRFRMDPLGQLRGLQRLEDEGRPLLAIYHSHPDGPSGLSSTDALEAAYPEAALVVISPGTTDWTARAFLVDAGAVREIPFLVEEPGPPQASGATKDTP
jgi:[CysO sulfur-carrier protein]-S-L-cysteine hydrolase